MFQVFQLFLKWADLVFKLLDYLLFGKKPDPLDQFSDIEVDVGIKSENRINVIADVDTSTTVALDAEKIFKDFEAKKKKEEKKDKEKKEEAKKSWKPYYQSPQGKKLLFSYQENQKHPIIIWVLDSE